MAGAVQDPRLVQSLGVVVGWLVQCGLQRQVLIENRREGSFSPNGHSPDASGMSASAPNGRCSSRELGTLNQVIVALGKTIRAMADGSIDSQVGSRICNGLGIMRQCLETRSLDQLGERLDQLENPRGERVSYGSAKHAQPHHVAH
jgi:hypothetical protein